MRILVASESFYPAVSGVSITSERLARQIASRGHQVTVLAPSNSRSFYKEERMGYTIYRIPSWINPFRRGFRFTVFPRRWVERVFREVKPELVHLHDPATLCTATARAARKRKLPIVATNHFAFDYLETYLPKWFNFIYFFVKPFLRMSVYSFYNHASVLTVPTKTAKGLIADDLRVQILPISNGVDITRFSLYFAPWELVERYKLSLDTPVITFVGRLQAEKNVSTLIKALGKVKNSFQAIILGEGNALDDLKAEAQELGISDKIFFIPRFENSSSLLNQLYNFTNILCLPSIIETESMVIMEAMAAGLPVIASRVGALPELVEDGVNGYLLGAHDIQGWTEKIDHLLENPELRESMSRRSIEKITERDLEKTVDAYENLYRKLITGSKVIDPAG